MLVGPSCLEIIQTQQTDVDRLLSEETKTKHERFCLYPWRRLLIVMFSFRHRNHISIIDDHLLSFAEEHKNKSLPEHHVEVNNSLVFLIRLLYYCPFHKQKQTDVNPQSSLYESLVESFVIFQVKTAGRSDQFRFRYFGPLSLREFLMLGLRQRTAKRIEKKSL